MDLLAGLYDSLAHSADDSWVAQVAYVFRILAFTAALPMAVITALDVASYLIVRTLGAPLDMKRGHVVQPVLSDSNPGLIPPPLQNPAVYLSPAQEDAAFQLSGANVFSPPPSRPVTPPKSQVRRRIPQAHLNSNDPS